VAGARADGSGGRRLVQGGLAVALALVAISIESAPLGLGPLDRSSPDLLFCVLAVWAARRPRAVPLLVVFALGLLRDFLTDPPIGIGALSLVAATEVIKARARALSRQGFLVEWLLAAVAVAGMLAMQWLALFVSFAQPPYLSLLLEHALFTLLVYPLMAMLVGLVLRRRWRDGRVA